MKMKRFKSLTVFLVAGIFVIGLVLVSSLQLISSRAAYKAVEFSYLNQLQNMSRCVSQQLDYIVEEQAKTAMSFVASPVIREAIHSGNLKEAEEVVKRHFKVYGIYEDVFVSTAEKNPMVLVAGSGRAAGIRWGNIGFDDNIENNLKGKVHVSRPGKSPATGWAVCLISAPIMEGKRVIGILGLSLNLGVLSQEIIKDVKLGKTGYMFVTDDNGITIAHPDKKQIFNMNIRKFNWGKKALNMKNGESIFYEYNGVEKIAAVYRSPQYNLITMTVLHVSDIKTDTNAMALLLLLIGFIGIVISSPATFYFISRKLKPLTRCRDILKDMAKGDLSVRYDGKVSEDEIGDMVQAVNTSMDQLEKLISSVIASAQNLAQAVEQISNGNQNLSHRTSEQASSLEEIASTIEEATATIKQNAENAQEANRMSEESLRLGDESDRVVNEAVVSINEISESGKKIGDIISVINEIAFQTNLLALNAAVEAARAGEQGRGFAVVAGEVRNLAQRAGSAAKEIDILIKDSLEKVERGTDLSNSSGKALMEIVKSIKKMGQIISEIAMASEEQRQGIEQINVAISEMDSMTQQNAALVEETASASEEMSNQAQELLILVERFKVRDHLREASLGRHKEVYQQDRDCNGDGTKAVLKDDGNGRGDLSIAQLDLDKIEIHESLTQDGYKEF